MFMRMVNFVAAVFMFTSLVSALELSVPSTITVGENITAIIGDESSEQADIKLFIEDAQHHVLSETYVPEEGWRSSFYYAKNAWPEHREFTLRAKNVTEQAKLCVRLRQSIQPLQFREQCEAVEILPAVKSPRTLPMPTQPPLSAAARSQEFYSQEYFINTALAVLALLLSLFVLLFFIQKTMGARFIEDVSPRLPSRIGDSRGLDAREPT